MVPCNKKKLKEINQTMAHRNVGFLEVRKFLKNCNNPGGRTLLSLQVLEASEGTLTLMRVTCPFSKREKTKGVG
jgi:hypothetical protein